LNITKFLKNNIVLIFAFPVLANSLLNLFLNFDQIIFERIYIMKFISFLLGTIFFFFISNTINNTFKVGGRAISLVIFFTSYFTIDSIFLFISKNLTFKSLIIYISAIWIMLLIYKSESIVNILKIFFSYLIWRLFNNNFFDDISNNTNYSELNTDVPEQWFDIARMIYENNYYFALENNLIEGQGLLPSYIQAFLLEVGFNVERFQFIQITSFLFLSFSILLIADLHISKKEKIIFSLVFISLILNNNWLEYLLVNSLMIEGIVSFFISVYLFNYSRMLKNVNTISFLFFLTFGALVLTKNFVSLISLVIIILSVFLLRKNIYIILSTVIYLLNLIYQRIYFSELQNFAYTSEIDFKDLIFDFIYLRDLDFSNIVNIINQFLIDKPTSYIVLVFLIANIFGIFVQKSNTTEDNIILFFIIINYILVNLLYISYWRNVEYESSYRYIISCFHLIYLSLIIQLSKFQKI
tara:strand:+ start:10523 stop:11926 length:1404 start_codon:yes stop_codon:yes gene_type:complete